MLWWSHLVISPLWADGLSFGHLLEMAREHTAHRQQLSFLYNAFPGFPLSPVVMPSQLNGWPFDIPSLPQWLYAFERNEAVY